LQYQLKQQLPLP